MKITKLFLRAFGPFTDTVLDFSGAARLHVIYGPNEAGKSSALRAMGDLRYGIPVNSADNFVHDYKTMALAAVFESATGQACALARRKGNKDTLQLADAHSGLPIAGAQVPPEWLLALTGGVDRKQFETMYGLNSAHLREGGKLLISGAGELGTALFEASTGAAGVKALLTGLQEQAKSYYAPRSQSAQLNEAVKQLDEARKRLREAVTKPEHWKGLQRAHDEAGQKLAEVRQQLAHLRRRVTELAAYRAVEPMLRSLERIESAWREVKDYRLVAEDASAMRLAAQQSARQARDRLAEAEQGLLRQGEERALLRMEPALLEQGRAIDRLLASAAMVQRGRDQRIALSAAARASEKRLTQEMHRILPATAQTQALDAFYATLLSLSEQAALQQAMDAWRDQLREQTAAQAQRTSAEDKVRQWASQQLSEPSAPLLAGLSQALAAAQGLGNVDVRLGALSHAQDAEQRKLNRLLKDLGLQGLEHLLGAQWLAAAELDEYEHASEALDRQLEANRAEAGRTQADLSDQKLRRQQLAAVGEVVTADTLDAARTARDQDWQAIRAEYIDLPITGADASNAQTKPRTAGLPAAFEQAKAEADRQADLLREGAQRAAEVAECAQRMADMEHGLQALKAQQAALQAQAHALEQAWQARLDALSLPRMSAAAAREWMGLRQTALDGHERVLEREQEVQALAQQLGQARGRLGAALQALGLSPVAGDEPLASAIVRAKAAEQDLLEARLSLQHRAADMAEQEQQRQQATTRLSALDAQIGQSRAALDQACARVHLPFACAPDVIQVRLQELRAWAQAYAEHSDSLRQLGLHEAAQSALQDEAKAVAQLLNEPPPSGPGAQLDASLDAWLDGLTQRLSDSRQALQQQDHLDRLLRDEGLRKHKAERELAAAQDALKALIRQADVVSEDELPEAEARSDRQRQVAHQLQQQREQLALASSKDAPTLRAELANQDSQQLELEKLSCEEQIGQLEAQEQAAIAAEHESQQALARIDTSDAAALAREEMEAALARYRAGVRPWAQLKLAEALLTEAVRRHREKAQGPMVALAGEYFRLMTGGRFVRLSVDADAELPVLLAQPVQGRAVEVAALSEGTADQLYLALRLAALELQRTPQRSMPLVLDDVFMTSDDERAAHMFRALARFAEQGQVLLFTHHRHLTEIASQAVQALGLHRLDCMP